MRIDQATAADVPALGDLLTVLFSQEAEFTPDAPAQCRGLAQIIDHPDRGTVLVAREGDHLIGMVNLLLSLIHI